jgi:hypothetical protein
MILLKLTDRYLNLDHLVDAQIRREKDGTPAVGLFFAAPQRANVDAEDWLADTYSVTLRGADAATVLAWLDGRWDRDRPLDLDSLPPEAYDPRDRQRKPTIAPWPDPIGPDDEEGVST